MFDVVIARGIMLPGIGITLLPLPKLLGGSCIFMPPHW